MDNLEEISSSIDKINESVESEEILEMIQGDNLEKAQDYIKQELGIVSVNNEKEIAQKIVKETKKDGLFNKLKNSKTFKAMLLSFMLMKPELGMSQEKVASEKEFIQSKEKYEKNIDILSEREYVVSEEVMTIFANVVDPSAMGVPAGGFFDKNYLNTEERKSNFIKALQEKKYTNEDIDNYVDMFQGNKIVFNEEALKSSEFTEILEHERLHKEIQELPLEKLEELNKARDFILNDFKEKEDLSSNKIDELMMDLQAGKISLDEYGVKSKQIKLEQNPILLDKDKDFGGLLPVIRNPKEFYTYLMMGKFQPKVLDYIRSNFSKAYIIYSQLEEKIKLEIIIKQEKNN